MQPRRDGGVDGGRGPMRGGHVCRVGWAEVEKATKKKTAKKKVAATKKRTMKNATV